MLTENGAKKTWPPLYQDELGKKDDEAHQGRDNQEPAPEASALAPGRWRPVEVRCGC